MKEAIKFISIIAGFLLVVLAGALLLPEMEYYRSIFDYVAGSLTVIYLFITLQVLLFFWFRYTKFIKKFLWIFNFFIIGLVIFLFGNFNGDIREPWLALYIFSIIVPIVLLILPNDFF